MSAGPPPGTIPFGSNANCTLDICPAEWSIYTYRPSLPANITLLALFGAICLIHTYLGWRWKAWGFMIGILVGCAGEITGYYGRIMLYDNPFSFNGFIINIVCLTISPVFFTASIYMTLSNSILYYAPDLSRFKPKLYVWVFLPADIVCLILQATGGGLSATSTTNDNPGVDISMAGLILQLVVLVVFIAAFVDFMLRFWRSGRMTGLGWRFKAFFSGISVSTILILGRCAYRAAELKDGYSGELFHEEVSFIIFEGGFIAMACVALCFGHPGLAFQRSERRPLYSRDSEMIMFADTEMKEMNR